jgi:predicted metal-dependent HD superfamily phosphohydrolase
MSDLTSIERWRAVCDALGVVDVDLEHRRLIRAWSQWGRHYHTLHHLAACLHELDAARAVAERPAEVELALWFHDAIYRTYRNDNEERSANWAERFLASRHAAPETISRVTHMVRATAHGAAELAGDVALVVDIDLSILGQPEAVYDEFERNVRKEYWWVSKKRYRTARREILQSFLARPTIYCWQPFRQRYEASARRNLERSIRALV